MKMLVFDLDGTLLSGDGYVSLKTKEYLIKKKEDNYKIVVATGRVKNSAIEVTRGGDMVDIFINDTGALIYDNNFKRELFVKHLSSSFAEYVLDLYDKEKIHFIDVCDHDYIYKLTDTPEDNPVVINVSSKEEILDNIGDIIHVGIDAYENHVAINMYNDLKRQFPELTIILMQDSFATRKWIEIMPSGCTKTNAIKWVAEYYNINNDDIICFGDGLNDVDMLENCGLGVAMANALDEVKEVANLVTRKTNVEDGIVDFLENYLK
ncbi:MAG: Cof-type HAD-IIB family hydrolase [Bacilli bacterium]|nr:Cof-type HAD-IIB family hydrolase [Bacilli bacterium]